MSGKNMNIHFIAQGNALHKLVMQSFHSAIIFRTNSWNVKQRCSVLVSYPVLMVLKLPTLVFFVVVNCVASWPEVLAISAYYECIFPLPSHSCRPLQWISGKNGLRLFFSSLNSNIACVREWKTRLKNMQQEANWQEWMAEPEARPVAATKK